MIRNGKQYYIIFVEDYSRFTKSYVNRNKMKHLKCL